MKPDAIKAELRRLLTEAKKLEGDLVSHQVEWATWSSQSNGELPPDWLTEKDDELVYPFEYLSTSLYLTTVCFLDASQLHAYLRLFYQKFGTKFNANNSANEFDLKDFYWSGEPSNTFLTALTQFLSPLDVIGDADRYLKLSGVQYLETVLKNTASIIHNTGKNPTSETQVYQAVKHVLTNIFPSAKHPKSNFFKTAQEYKPDILIPELSSVVEYKYATDEVKLKAVIAQIADDVKGYTGDNDYNLFYAVFYVTNDFWGQAKFDEVWKEKEFPKNWRSYYIVGK